jgi:very-short-patch-repair endonuclease
MHFPDIKECIFFIPDFYCREEMLCIELDGPVHDDRSERDQIRDQILLAKGIRTLRIQNEDLADIDKVLARISASFRG